MKIQFDPNQSFQLDEVAAVTDLFDGQPQGAPEYAVMSLGSMEGLFAGQDRSDLKVSIPLSSREGSSYGMMVNRRIPRGR